MKVENEQRTQPSTSPEASTSTTQGDGPPKKKQKRNKPTLSCEECVERKTKRQSTCKYSDIANLIASSADKVGAGRSATGRSRKTSAKPPLQLGSDPQQHGKPVQVQVQVPPTPVRTQYRSVSLSSSGSSTFLLSNIPYSNHTPVPFFGLGSEHPFANYWTSRGGLAEVVGVLPAKEQADILVDKYFDAVDPVYPMVHRRNFYADYERFWSLPLDEKHAADPVLVALHFVVYAMGTQFIHTTDNRERAQIAEFYISAAQQALRISSYLSRASVRTLQAMVLIGYFLMNDNHASDAWAFGGVLVRQAYAMGLHRDPDIIAPRCSRSDKQQRRKLWQAIYFQDTFLTVLLKLPPTTVFSDIQPESLSDDLDDYIPNGSSSNGATDSVINPMSISNIASNLDLYPPYELSDRRYIRSMWHMANLVSRTVCIPRSLATPLTTSTAHKAELVNEYFALHRSFPVKLTASDDATIRTMAEQNPRGLRQNLFFRSNFWHCVMAIQADENPAESVPCDVKGALDAARMALQSFFHFWEHLRIDASVWWVFQHRAFEEALLMARILGQQSQPLSPCQSGESPAADPLLKDAKDDARRCLEILDLVSSAPEMQKTRTEVLRTAFSDILW
ncbi:zn 2cys6 transcription factor [Stemphylium lycopersici]|uniref:Zn 2cys6 transcription factor n=1 Tax=Stemphylium lycopersici TaxID=183478 RepID=A0A364N271_STELY|nr:zn 2cys6 transcription factor [Stemphylium lycopersici]